MLNPDVKPKVINVKNDNEFQPIILDIYDESLFFHDLFKRAAGIILEIVDRSFKYMKSDDKNASVINYPNNILAFCADRGQGKTTALISMARALSDLDTYSGNNSREKITAFWKSIHFFNGKTDINFFDVRFEVLEILDPTMMNCKDSILRTVISKMYKSISSKWNQNHLYDNKHENEGKLLTEKEELVEKFLNCFKAIDNIYGDTNSESFSDAYEDLSRISEIGDDITVKVSFAELVDKYLGFCRLISGDKRNSILVIQIDDADLNTKYAYEIAEEIRKFFIVPNVIVMMALHVGTLSRTIQQHYIEQYKTLLDTKTNAITYDRCHSMMEKYIEKLIPTPHQLYVPVINNIIKYNSDEITINRFKKNEATQENVLISFDKNILSSEYRENYDDIKGGCLDYQEYLMVYLYKKTGIMLVKPEGYLHNFIPSNMRELSQFFSYFNRLEDVVITTKLSGFDGIKNVLSKCKKLNKRKICDLNKIIEVNLNNIQYLFEYYYNNWCTMHLNDAEIQIIERINNAPLSIKNKTVVEQIKKYLEEKENANERAIIYDIHTIIGIHEQDYAKYPHTPLSDVMFTLYNVKNKTENPQSYYKFICAIEMYYTIYMRRLAFLGLKNWLKTAKNSNDYLPVGSPFERICQLTEYRIFPELYYSLHNNMLNTGLVSVINPYDLNISIERFLNLQCCPIEDEIKKYNIRLNADNIGSGSYYAYGSRILSTYLTINDFYNEYYVVDNSNLWELVPWFLSIVCNFDIQKLLYHNYFKNELYTDNITGDFITDVKTMIMSFDAVLNSNLMYNYTFNMYDCLQLNKQFFNPKYINKQIEFKKSNTAN